MRADQPGATCHWRLAGVAAVLLAGALSVPARAELGGSRRGVEADRAHLKAAMTTTAVANHSVHVLALADGGEVREYLDDAGTVFAVAWTAPGRPDLRQLLGPGFDTFQAAAVGPRRRSRHVVVARDGLVVDSAGHPGAFHGFAYLPARLPPGFTADALQ